MKKTKIVIPWKQTIALLLFFATSFGVTAYSLGYFALSDSPPKAQADADTFAPFFPIIPPSDDSSEPDDNSDRPPNNDSTTPLPTDYLTNLSKAFNTNLIEGYTADRTSLSVAQRIEFYNKLAAGIETVPDALPTSYESYTADGYTLVRGQRFEGDFTLGTEVITRYTKRYSDIDGSYTTVATDYTVARKKVQPYMGYLIISNESAEGEVILSLCDRSGNLLIEDLGDKSPSYARDNKNRPVFTDSEGSYYAFDGSKFIEINESALRIWLSYDYPAYPLGVYRHYEVVYDPYTGTYNYKNISTNSYSVYTDYFQAFNFTENGYAVVVTSTENVLQVVNRYKSVRFNAGGRYRFPTGDSGHGLSAKNIFRLPDTLGIESIGSTGYDHGWLRIRVQALSQMSNSLGTVIRDWEALVDERGNYFDIPEGYTLEGYSDGVLLLSKDGLYGYYSIEGKWITQPIFSYARPFIQGLAVVGSESGTVGMIDTSGNIVLPFVYTSLSDVSSGVITAYCEGIGWETYYLLKK